MEASTTEIHHQGRKEMSGAMKNKMTASRRFRPWENLRKLFRRKNLEEDEVEEMGRNKEGTKRRSSVTHRLSGVFGSVTASLNRSGTDVTIDKSQPALFRSGKSAKGSLLVSGNSGLSRSHDSFPGLYNDDETSSEIVESPVTTVVENVNIIPSSAASPQYMNELRAALGARLRSTPSAVDPIHGSSATSAPVMMPSGSDPSLLGGVNSCELADEVPFMSLQVGMTSRNAAAKMLVNEIIRDDDHDVEEESSSSAPVSSFPLNHSAARHKISIRPKKNHAPARQTRLAVVTQLDAVHVEEESVFIPSAPERKSRMDRNNSNKQRSISLSRTLEHSELSAGVMEAPLHPSEVIGSASSTSKLSRSRSSVEKKIQHEVAVFWRRTKEVGGGLFGGNRTAGSMKDINKQEGSRMTDEREASASVAANNNKRKDLKKIKRDKEEKKTNKNKSDPNGNKTDSESSPPAFLSRIFRSRRSSKRINNKKATSNNTEPLKTEPIEELLWVRKEDVPVVTPNHQLPPLPKPRTVFLPPKTAEVAPPGNKTKISDDEMEVDWTAPNRSSCNNRNSQQQQQDSFVRVASPKLNRNREPSPLRHHRIHIAGLSPYQRRVARIGNGLEISDDEWDMEDPSGNGNSVSSPTRSYHFRPEVHHNYNRSDHSLDVADGLTSLPVNINQDFILRKAPVHQRQPSPPTEPPALATTTSNMRRSLEILKFSNTEGLKKTIDSLNQARLSRSSDELSNMTEDMFINGRAARRVSGQRRQSSGSMSNSTSSLNISDLGGEEEVLMTASSQVSLSQHSVEDQRDVRDDVQEVHDQFRWNVNLLEGQRRTETNDEVDTSETSLPMDPSSPKSPSSPKDPLIITPSPGIRISQQPWESRQQTTPPTMFSMSVRVQNPLDNNIAKYKRSVSTPNEDQLQPTSFQPHRNSLPKPFVPTVEDRPPIHQPSAQLAKLVTARPWQSKEEKERQNKVAAVIVAPRPEEPEIPADVKLRSKSRSSTPPESSSPTGQETSELLKVFARRSSKIETPPEEAEAAPQWSRGAMPAVGRSPTEAPESLPVEKMEPAKRKKSPKPLPTMVAPIPRSPPAVVTGGIGAAVSISQPEEREKNVPSSPESMGSPQSLIQTGPHTSFPYIRLPDSIKSPVVDITNNRITTQSSPDSANSVEDIWKRMPSANKSNAIRARGFSGSSKFSPVTKSPPNQEDKVAAATTTGPVRQSKVLDMVHNFQRLQVT